MAVFAALSLLGCGRATGDRSAPEHAVADEPRDAPAAVPAPQTPADATAQPAEPSKDAVSACLIQDGRRIPENPIRAVGTEPFWAADVHGRCVAYSTPENQSGTRVWTKFEGRSDEGKWTGALDGQTFVMTTRRQAGCSDGMSDKSYPIAVTLAVRGEQRRGCAEPR